MGGTTADRTLQNVVRDVPMTTCGEAGYEAEYKRTEHASVVRRKLKALALGFGLRGLFPR